jgi:hypothetical protein
MGDIKNDGIVIFCAKGGVMFTSAGEIDTQSKKVRKHNKNRAIVHQVFEDMREFNKSPYWDDVLQRWSRNVFPRNFKYYKDTLRYALKRKTNKREFYIDKEDLQKTFEELKVFLEDKGIVSVIEKKEKLISSRRKESSENRCDSWKDLGGNQIFAVEKYIEKMRRKRDGEYNLESIIKFGISSDIFNNNTITVENSKIKGIEHLAWDEEEERYYIEISDVNVKFPRGKKGLGKGKYSSHTFSGEEFLIKTNANTAKVSKKWKDFLSDYYK